MIKRDGPARDQGAAVVAALLVAALVAVIGAAILLAQETWLAQINHRQDRQAVTQTLHAALNWARAALYQDRLSGDVDHSGEPWAQSLPPVDFEGVRVSGQIEDAQAYFNLNAIAPDGRVDTDALAAYQRLLIQLGLNEALAQALADWLDSNSETRAQGGAESDYYLALPKPYRAADAPMIDLSELIWVRGYTQADIDVLRPHVIALPSQESINVNTATVEVLVAATGLPLAQIRLFVASRETEPVTTTADINARLQGPFTPRAKLDVGTRYFITHGRGRKGDTQLRLAALIYRQGGDKNWPRVVWQRLE